MNGASAGAPPRLRIRGLKKRYAAPVLDDFDWEVAAGEVHALVGANGAGKSTLARLLTGLDRPDAGLMELDGLPHAPHSKRAAEASGVVLVQQELNLLPTLSVAENLFLDRLPNRFGWVRREELRRRAREALARVGLEALDPDTPADRLGVGARQLVEIAGALDRRCRLLILDEPTAALTDVESGRLFDNVRRLCESGVAVIYVSHRLEEIRRLARRASVMRDGRLLATVDPRTCSDEQFVARMSGATPTTRLERADRPLGAVRLRVVGLCAGPRVRDVSFEVRRGEILGLAGLVGSGRTELLRAVFGADPIERGAVYDGSHDSPLNIGRPIDAVRAGVGMAPEDRRAQALLLTQSVRANAVLAALDRFASRGRIDADAERRAAERLVDRSGVKCDGIEQPAWQLSGGNQQKIVLGRWLLRDVDVLLLDEPTRGVDAAAKAAVHEQLFAAARDGKALVVASSEQEELETLCDRILVLSAGRIVARFSRAEFHTTKILEAAFSGTVN